MARRTVPRRVVISEHGDEDEVRLAGETQVRADSFIAHVQNELRTVMPPGRIRACSIEVFPRARDFYVVVVMEKVELSS